jgi:hypothetical protein
MADELVIYTAIDVRSYCTREEGDCLSCSLSNYGRDCMNNRILPGESEEMVEALKKRYLYAGYPAGGG